MIIFMYIYFVGAISQLGEYRKRYQRIVDVLTKSGNKVQYDHILKQNLKDILTESDDDKIDYYKRFLTWLNKSDIVIAEASFPSTVHVGHELSLALEKDKPVVVLYLKGKAPVFLEGIKSDKLFLIEYEDENIEATVKAALEYASEQQDTRFNFFISPQIGNYLDWVAKKKRIPRAVYLRRLIEEDMKKNKQILD